jgi:hypothetical protein
MRGVVDFIYPLPPEAIADTGGTPRIGLSGAGKSWFRSAREWIMGRFATGRKPVQAPPPKSQIFGPLSLMVAMLGNTGIGDSW